MMICRAKPNHMPDQLRSKLQSWRLLMALSAGVSVHLHHHLVRPGSMAARVSAVRCIPSFYVLS